MKAQEFLTKAGDHMQDRASTYDKPQGERSMAATVGAFNAINGTTLTEEQGWMFMELLKIVRSVQGDYKADNYEDAVAYAALRGECASNTRGAKPDKNRDDALDAASYAIRLGTVGERMRDVFTPERKKEIVETLTDNYMKDEKLLASGKIRKMLTSDRFECTYCVGWGNTPLSVYHVKDCPNA